MNVIQFLKRVFLSPPTISPPRRTETVNDGFRKCECGCGYTKVSTETAEANRKLLKSNSATKPCLRCVDIDQYWLDYIRFQQQLREAQQADYNKLKPTANQKSPPSQ